MKYRALAFLTVAAVAAVLLSLPAAAQSPPGLGGGSTCAEVCSLSEPDTCLLGCQTPGGQNMACWQWFGQLDSDLDDDGVPNASDNCVCRANANQANCDGDPYGDVCDVDDTKWEFTENQPAICLIDVRPNWNNSGRPLLVAYDSRLYTNVCGNGGTCIDPRPKSEHHCTHSTSARDCCLLETNYPTGLCADYTVDACGSPSCPF